MSLGGLWLQLSRKVQLDHPQSDTVCIIHLISSPSLMCPIVVSTQEKPCICTDNPDRCKFRCSDPASLIRHRKRSHGYVPKSESLASESVRSATSTLPIPSESTSSPSPSIVPPFGDVDSPNPPPSQSLPPSCSYNYVCDTGSNFLVAEPDMESQQTLSQIPHDDSNIFCDWPSLSEPELHTNHYWDNLNFQSHYDAQISELLDYTFLNPNNS